MYRKKIRPIIFYAFLFCTGFLFLSVQSSLSSEQNKIHLIQLNDDTINPVTAEYIVESIDRAYEEGAQCLIITLDTPGGLLNSTRMIVKKMLGGTKNHYLGQADQMLRDMAVQEGYDDTYYTTEVSIYFGERGVTVPDPYFDGEGPDRTGCTFCGGCIVGCREGAKNSLDKNYLYLLYLYLHLQQSVHDWY